MKGIAHFVTGIALATLFPEVVEAAAQGSMLPVLGGVAALLPDTLDFRVVRFLERYDVEIDPGPTPNARLIAEQLVEAMREAYHTETALSVVLHTVRLGADQWRTYTVRFDAAAGEVAVRIGPVVDTGQHPLPGTEPNPAAPSDQARHAAEEARVRVGVPLMPTYQEETSIDIFSGPSFTFRRERECLHIGFLEWHRRWSHSLTLAAAMGLGAAAVAALVQRLAGATALAPSFAGLVVGLGVLGHILQDQLGFLGSSLLFPLTRHRTRGLGLLHSADGAPNFLTVWSALILILVNLDRFSDQPRLNPWWSLVLGIVAPWIAFVVVDRRQRVARDQEEALRQREILSEAEGDTFGQ